MSTVEKILSGSARMNVMQAEITQVLKILAGTVKGIGYTKFPSVEFSFPSVIWKGQDEKVTWSMYGGDEYGVYHFQVKMTTTCKYTDSQIYSLPSGMVRRVRESLDTFVDEFIEVIGADFSLQHILEVAELD